MCCSFVVFGAARYSTVALGYAGELTTLTSRSSEISWTWRVSPRHSSRPTTICQLPARRSPRSMASSRSWRLSGGVTDQCSPSERSSTSRVPGNLPIGTPAWSTRAISSSSFAPRRAVGSTISRPSSHVAALDVEGNDAANLAILGGDLGVARLYVARLGTFVLRFHSGPPPRAWALAAVVDHPEAEPRQLRLNGGYRSVISTNAYAVTRFPHRRTPSTKWNRPSG